jgi:HK97 family phage major capsid protein
LCQGDATSSYGHVNGLKNAIGSAGVYTCDANENLWSEIDLEDVILTMAKLPDRFNRNPVWICSTNFYWAVFGRLLAGGGGNTISQLQAGDNGIRSFLGVPVLTTAAMPTADSDSAIHALFGQFDMGVVLADRTGIRIGRDDSTGFLNDYTTLKATSRYDIKVHEPGDSSNAGAYVALKTNAA